MKKFNLIVVIDKDKQNVLMCKRAKPPYQGKYNFVGGKVEKGEEKLQAAYRELKEETSITDKDIKLDQLMTFLYYNNNIELQVYTGYLQKDIKFIEEVNKLKWVSLKENFFDIDKFAGKGNIGLILEEMGVIQNDF